MYFLRFIFFSFNYAQFGGGVWVGIHECRCPKRSQALTPRRTGVPGDCELLDMGDGDEPPVLHENSTCSLPLSHFSSPDVFFFLIKIVTMACTRENGPYSPTLSHGFRCPKGSQESLLETTGHLSSLALC